VAIDWNGLPVTDMYPKRLPDLFSGKPLVITGRYTAAASGKIRLRGNQAGENVAREIPVTLSSDVSKQDVLPSFWARRKIEELMSKDWSGLQGGTMKLELQKEITQLGLDYRLMTQFTSFVAVEERVVTKDGKPQRVEVPVEIPEGVSYEGVFGDRQPTTQGQVMLYSMARISRGVARKMQVGRGVGAGVGGGIAAGSYSTNGVPPGPPPPPPASTATETVNVEADSVSVADKTKPTGERAVLESKLHPTLLAAFDCWKQSGDNCKMVHDGKIEIQIFLTGTQPEISDQLKALGFEAKANSARKVLAGTLPIEKLQALIQITAVRFVSPLRA
jgi:Ca-activated chloride channel family protein